MPSKKKSARPLPADTEVTTERLPEEHKVRLTVSIRNTISLGKDSFSTISPGVSISQEFEEETDLVAAANHLYGRVTPVYGFLLLQEAQRMAVALKGGGGVPSIFNLSRELLNFQHAQPPADLDPESGTGTGLLD